MKPFLAALVSVLLFLSALIGTLELTKTSVAQNPPSYSGVRAGNYIPFGSSPVTASATGTTTAITATLTGAANQNTYLCGFSIRANATGAATGNAAVTGTVNTMNFTQFTAPLASGIGVVEEQFNPCIPSSAINTNIVVTTAAPGSGGAVSVSAWGYTY